MTQILRLIRYPEEKVAAAVARTPNLASTKSNSSRKHSPMKDKLAAIALLLAQLPVSSKPIHQEDRYGDEYHND